MTEHEVLILAVFLFCCAREDSGGISRLLVMLMAI